MKKILIPALLCLTLAALPFAAVRAYVHDGTLAAMSDRKIEMVDGQIVR